MTAQIQDYAIREMRRGDSRIKKIQTKTFGG